MPVFGKRHAAHARRARQRFHDDGTRLPLWTDNGLAPQRWIPRWEETRDDLPLPT
jgi:hypothetical protein